MGATLFSCLGCFENVFALVGAFIVLLFIGTTLFYLSKNIYVFYFAEKLGHTLDFKSFGEWAVVTGGTDGIGKGYAFDLARRGCNVIIISRSEEKLRNVSQEIKSKYNVRVRTITADFGEDETIYDKIKSELEGLEIGVLINNVGVGYPYPEYFHLVPGGEKTFLNLVRVNCVAQTLMTRIVIPQMIERKKGIVVHLSSGAAIDPVPFYAAYSASKAFNDFFGRALMQEYADKGIISQVVLPFVVATNMSKMRKTNLFIIDAFKYARSSLNTVGFFDRTNGHPSHAVQKWIVNLIPSFVARKVLHAVSLKMRDKVKAKQEKLAKEK